MKGRYDTVSRLDRPLQRERRRRYEPVRKPSILRDVIVPVVMLWVLMTFAVLPAVTLLKLETPWLASIGVGSICGTILLVFRLQTYDEASGFTETEVEMDYQVDDPVVEEEREKEVVVQVQTDKNSSRYGRTGVLDSLTKRQFRKLAQEILAAQETSGKITRDTLAQAAVFTNLTGPGRVAKYKYQDVFNDFQWLGWLTEGSELTPEGRTFFNHAARGRLSSSVVVQGSDGDWSGE